MGRHQLTGYVEDLYPCLSKIPWGACYPKTFPHKYDFFLRKNESNSLKFIFKTKLKKSNHKFNLFIIKQFLLILFYVNYIQLTILNNHFSKQLKKIIQGNYNSNSIKITLESSGGVFSLWYKRIFAICQC